MPRLPKKGWKPKFLKALRYVPNIARACRLAVISQQSAYDHRKNDEKFAKQWEEALETGMALLEERAQKLALNGVKHGVWKTVDGKPTKVEVVTEYSVPMMQFMLRAYYAKYRDQSRIEHVGALDAPPIQAQHAISQDLLDKLAEARAAKEKGGNGTGA